MIFQRASIVLMPFLVAAPPEAQPPVSESYEITSVRDSSEETSAGGTSSSHDQDALIEKVIAVEANGLELEYDLPQPVTQDERLRNWQFPARVFRSLDGKLQLRNAPELETRLVGWLKAAELSRSSCGHWIFTWNAFKIECDPQSVLKTIEAFDLRTDISEGATYQAINARPATVTRKSSGPNGTIFEVVMDIDPDAVRRARAETDVVVGEISRKPLTLDQAMAARSKDAISGTVLVRFETDSARQVFRKTEITKLETKKADGETETQVATWKIERKSLAQ